MPAQDPRAITAIAGTVARNRLDDLFADETTLAHEGADQRWDDHLLRTVQRDDFAVGRVFSTVQVETDALGRITRFSDSARLATAGAAPGAPFDQAALRQAAATTGLVSPHARVIGAHPRGDGFVVLTVNQYIPGYPAWTDFTIDPGRGLVAALEVTMWDEP